jgi:uncharacterized membrane protein YagU involved in acid resistance
MVAISLMIGKVLSSLSIFLGTSIVLPPRISGSGKMNQPEVFLGLLGHESLATAVLLIGDLES